MSPKERDPLWDALASWCGLNADDVGGFRGEMNRSLAGLRRQGIGLSQLEEVVRWYRAKFPRCEVTPTALNKWAAKWSVEANARAKAINDARQQRTKDTTQRLADVEAKLKLTRIDEKTRWQLEDYRDDLRRELGWS